MNNQRLNIIIGNRAERIPRLMNELQTQHIENYKLWDGIFLPSIKESINAAFKQIVRYAKLAEFGEVIIAEDDVKFSRPGAWQYYLSQKPVDYDLYLGGIFIGELDEKNEVKDFTGMTLITINSRFYDTFLNTPNDEHIDRALNGLGRFIVCSPFVVTQYDGVSSNSGQFEKYGELQASRNFW